MTEATGGKDGEAIGGRTEPPKAHVLLSGWAPTAQGNAAKGPALTGGAAHRQRQKQKVEEGPRQGPEGKPR
jgi:hypothetical protein